MKNSRGFTLVELLIVIAVVGVLLSISLAGYRNARMQGNEAVAIATLDSVNQAQFAYMQTCGRQHYAPSFVELGAPVPATGQPFLSPDLTAAEQLTKSGYVYQMSGTAVGDGLQSCTGATPVSSYQLTADPLNPGVSGNRYFGTNADRVIFYDQATFTGRMPETGPPDHGAELRASPR